MVNTSIIGVVMKVTEETTIPGLPAGQWGLRKYGIAWAERGDGTPMAFKTRDEARAYVTAVKTTRMLKAWEENGIHDCG